MSINWDSFNVDLRWQSWLLTPPTVYWEIWSCDSDGTPTTLLQSGDFDSSVLTPPGSWITKTISIAPIDMSGPIEYCVTFAAAPLESETVGNVQIKKASSSKATYISGGAARVSGVWSLSSESYIGLRCYAGTTLFINQYSSGSLITLNTYADSPRYFGGKFLVGPGLVSKVGPTNEETDIDFTSLIFSWDSAIRATYYNLYYRTVGGSWSSSYGTPDPYIVASAVGIKLKSLTEYEWRVDSSNDYSGTTDTVVWSFTTFDGPPGKPINPTPSNTSTGIKLSYSTITWESGS